MNLTSPATTPQQEGRAAPLEGSLGRTDLLLCLCIAIWGFNFVAVKIALREGFSPLALVGLRFPLFGLAMLVVAYAVERDLRIHRRHLWSLVVLAVVGLGLNQLLWTFGMKLTLAPKASILMTTTPVFAALFAPLFREARLSKLGWLGILVALGGSALVVTGGSLRQHLSSSATLGDVLILLASLLVGAVTAGSRPLLRHYSALKYTTYHVCFGAMFLLPITATHVLATDFSAVTTRAWLGLLYSIFFAGVTGFWIWYNGVEKIGAARTAIYQAAMPITTLLGAWLVLRDEMVGWVHLLGAAITLAGVWMARRY